MTDYKSPQLFIDGRWMPSASGRTIAVINPATEEAIGSVPHANEVDLAAAVAAAQRGFQVWRNVSAFDRSKILRQAATLLRERAEDIARLLTLEQGKIHAEALAEAMASADVIDWFAEEGKRAYGRVIPGRAMGVQQLAVREPVGPVAAFAPWNFPLNQVVRKLAAALAAGCSIIVKAPEEAPASPAELVRAFADAGVPNGVINLVYGIPAEVSGYLIPHPAIRKISFTGSTAVGKQLAALAGLHMKRATMELGGHGPAIICEDADIDAAVRNLAFAKFRNAGQICVSPTRFLVHEKRFESFLDKFVAAAAALKPGNGSDPSSTIGPLANGRRLSAMQELVDNAVAHGARLHLGGKRIGNRGFFFEPTVLSRVPQDCRVMNEEPFGPIALVNSFSDLDEAIAEANRLPYGLAAYAYTKSSAESRKLATQVETGLLTINHNGLALPETPFGGVKDSGYGSEGGAEALDCYLVTKFISQLD